MTEPLPTFKYHPDPIATECIEPSPDTCVCCKAARGYIYVGPVYAEKELDRQICPWCIADGKAHEKYGADFTDPHSIGAHVDWCDVDEEIIETIAHRTPGFCGWQQEQWFTCCNDAGVFLGPVGHRELLAAGPQAIAAIQNDCGLEGQRWTSFFEALTKYESPQAYLFRCIHCGKFGGYTDCA